MADGFFSALCSLALKQLNLEGLEQIRDWLGDHFSDQGRRLTNALKASNEKAWRALEIALAGESLWNKLDRADDRAFRQQLAGFLKQLPLPELDGKQVSRKQILENIRDAKKQGLLFGRLLPQDLADRVGPMADRTDPQKVLVAERKALGDMAAFLKRAKLDALSWLLEQPVQPGQSLLIVSVRFYFRRTVEADAELARGLQFTAMENLTQAQQKGFEDLETGLEAHAGRVEQALRDLTEIAEKMLGAAGEVRDAALDLRSEMERMRGDHHELYAKVLQMLEQQEMLQRPVRAGDSLSIRSDAERQRVKDCLAHYRRLPEEQKQASPALLNGLGKLQVATGDYQSAQENFTRVAELSPDDRSRAEGHYNAYHAALERAALEDGSYEIALAELKQALRYDPARFAPFPLDQYEPSRILGAGGFGVTFLCRKVMMNREVAVKALQTEGLDRDASAVVNEASLLTEIRHPAIIQVYHCGYADPERKRPFLEMDYFEGATLQEYVRKNGSLSVGNLLALAKIVAEGLKEAHAKGILHRDVKPGNLLVKCPEGRWDVRIIDFGLAMKQDLLGAGTSSSGSHRSMTGAQIAGTRHYAAPEQMGELPGVRVGTWSDVYGWAKTCCYALFQNTEPTFLDYRKLPETLGILLGQCLARMPNDRPSGFAEVLERLVKIRPDATKGGPPKLKPAPQPPPQKSLQPFQPVVVLPKAKPAAALPTAVEVRPITELGADDKRRPPAAPVYPQAIPIGRSSSRHPKAPPLPPSAPPPRRSTRPLARRIAGKDPGQAVKAPGLAIALNGLASVLLNGIFAIVALVEPKAFGTDREFGPILVMIYGVFVIASLATAVCGFVMFNRKAYTVCLIGCFLSLLPIGSCCIAGLPIGIWGIATLMRPDVKNSFT
ncbi:MAG TPA: protein kinase [Gemmataceae bacterium]|nr:protein kinase [Gemmataceae bacterium]